MTDPESTIAGEPWWVVVARMGPGQDFASTTVDAPTAEAARPEGERVITAYEGRQVERIARVTGPFPRTVITDERERRPSGCGGCGLARYCGNHPPTPNQTWFEELDHQQDGGGRFECVNCGTITWLPEDHMEVTP